MQTIQDQNLLRKCYVIKNKLWKKVYYINKFVKTEKMKRKKSKDIQIAVIKIIKHKNFVEKAKIIVKS